MKSRPEFGEPSPKCALEKETWPGGWKSRERMIMSKRQPFSVRSLLISGTIDCPFATLSEPTRSHSSVPPRAGGVHTENMSSDDGRLVKHFCVSTMIRADFAIVAGPYRDSIGGGDGL